MSIPRKGYHGFESHRLRHSPPQKFSVLCLAVQVAGMSRLLALIPFVGRNRAAFWEAVSGVRDGRSRAVEESGRFRPRSPGNRELTGNSIALNWERSGHEQGIAAAEQGTSCKSQDWLARRWRCSDQRRGISHSIRRASVNARGSDQCRGDFQHLVVLSGNAPCRWFCVVRQEKSAN